MLRKSLKHNVISRKTNTGKLVAVPELPGWFLAQQGRIKALRDSKRDFLAAFPGVR
jgi:predicted deacylase